MTWRCSPEYISHRAQITHKRHTAIHQIGSIILQLDVAPPGPRRNDCCLVEEYLPVETGTNILLSIKLNLG